MEAFLFLLLCNVAVFGSHDHGFEQFPCSGTCSPIQNSAYLYAQYLDMSHLTDGLLVMNNDGFAAADNFILSSESNIGSVTFWTVYENTHPNDITIEIFENTGGFQGNYIWGETVPTVYMTETFTGLTFLDYDIWELKLDLQTGLTLAEGEYWLTMTVLNSFDLNAWLIGDPIYTDDMYQISYGDWQIVPYDAFFIIEGIETPLDRQTWAGIKSIW